MLSHLYRQPVNTPSLALQASPNTQSRKSNTSDDYLYEMRNKSSFGNRVIMRHVSDLFLKITINLLILGNFDIVFDVFENCQMGRKYYNKKKKICIILNTFEFFCREASSHSDVILMAQNICSLSQLFANSAISFIIFDEVL